MNLYDVFAQAVMRAADQTALIQGDVTWTYRHLEQQVDRLAAVLQARGVQKGDCVLIYGPKSPWTVAFLLAILRVGAAYAPIEFGTPVTAFRMLLENSGARVICITAPQHARVRQSLNGVALDRVVPDDVAEAPPVSVAVDVDASNTAYILFTSGSTGKPKGIAHSHDSALAFVEWAVHHVGARHSDVFANHASFSFDLSVFDLFGSMWVAAPLVILSETQLKFPGEIVQMIETHGVTIWYSVPSALIQLCELDAHAVFNKLRVIIFAGEVFPQEHLKRLLSAAPSPSYFNFFGPTETNVCTYWNVEPESVAAATTIPIGLPCPYCDVQLLGDNGELNTAEGEILVSGPNVTKGYWRNGALDVQADKLLESPAQSLPTYFRTGDYASRDEAGLLWFHGRRDRQVKIHGFRVELDSVEAGLCAMPQIHSAMAVVFGGNGRTYLGAAVTLTDVSVAQDHELMALAARQLKPQDTPEVLLVLSELPRTLRGKYDYAAIVQRFEESKHG